ncbi:hypothetical protein ACP275_05G007500 [Erythranthe tilingii]
MGVSFSKPSESSPSSTATATATTTAAAAATSSPNEQTHSPESPESETPIQKNPDRPTDTSDQSRKNLEKVSEDSIKKEDGEEEEGECGFCLFMKSGGCKEAFTEWEKCVDEGEKMKENVVEKCFQATSALKKCMEVHTDYYAPVLQAEKTAEEQVFKQLNEDLNTQESEKKEPEQT